MGREYGQNSPWQAKPRLYPTPGTRRPLHDTRQLNRRISARRSSRRTCSTLMTKTETLPTHMQLSSIGRLHDIIPALESHRMTKAMVSLGRLYDRSLTQPSSPALPWRLKSRLKTFNAGLFICLNIGVDPPDVVKTNPCAKLECWLDPAALPAVKAIEAIGRSEPRHGHREILFLTAGRSAATIRDTQSQSQISKCTARCETFR